MKYKHVRGIMSRVGLHYISGSIMLSTQNTREATASTPMTALNLSHYVHPSIDKSGALLSSLTLGLAESALADALVHRLVLTKDKLAHGSSNSSQEPSHDAMAPVRR